MDTTTINFAISKMTHAWQKAAPTIANVSEKYIRFVVAKQVIQASLLAIVLMVGCVIFSKGYKGGKIAHWRDGAWIAPLIVGGLLTFVGGIGVMCEGYDAILALCCPEMYTIHNLIGK